MLRKTFLPSSILPVSLSRHLTYSTIRQASTRAISYEASTLRSLNSPKASGFFEPNPNPHPTFITPIASSHAFSLEPPFPDTIGHQRSPQAVARQAAQAIRTCILQNNDQRNAYAILNSLYQHSAASPKSPIPTRLATSALIHSLIRVGSPFRAAQIAETAWIGTSALPIEYANSMRLHWRTSDSIVTALTSHHLLPSSQPSPPPPPLSKHDLAHLNYLQKRAGVGEGTPNPSKTRLDHSSQRALLFLRVARNARQQRQQAMYGKIIEVCLLQGEIIIATLLFVLLVRDYQVKQMVKDAKEEYNINKENQFSAEASVEEWPKLTTDVGVLSHSLAERKSISWLSTISPNILARLESLKQVDIEKAIQLGLDHVDKDGDAMSSHPLVAGGEYLKVICGALDLRFGGRQLQIGGEGMAASTSGASTYMDGSSTSLHSEDYQHSQSIPAFSQLVQLASDLTLKEYGTLPEKIAHYIASRVPPHLQPTVSRQPRLLDSYALREIPKLALSDETDLGEEQIPLGKLCHSTLVNLSHQFITSRQFALTPSNQHALIQYAYFCNNTRLATKLVKAIQDRGDQVSANTYSVIITGLVKCGRLDAAKEVIEMVRTTENIEVTPMAKVLIEAVVGDVDALKAQEQEEEDKRVAKKKGKKTKKHDAQSLSPHYTCSKSSVDLLKFGRPLNKQDNLSIALIYYATSTPSQPDIVAQMLPTILPHAFDDALLFPPTSLISSEAYSLNLIASYGPRFYIELMNALRKNGHTGFVERVWNVATQASKHSWRMYVKRKMKEVMKTSTAVGSVTSGEESGIAGGLNVALGYAASSPRLSTTGARRQRQMTKGPNGWEVRMWDDMPWLVDIGAWTMLMKVYGMERKKGLEVIADQSPNSSDKPNSAIDFEQEGRKHNNLNLYARGWGGCPARFRVMLPRDQLKYIHESPALSGSHQPRRRSDLALECAWMLHTSLTALRDDMVQFVDDVWAEREDKHRLYDPAKSSRTVQEGEEDRKKADLEILKQRVYHKLQKAIPEPNERYFNAALQVFGRGDSMKGRVNGMFNRQQSLDRDDQAIRFLQERYVQVREDDPPCSSDDVDQAGMSRMALHRLKKDLEMFGYEMPQVYQLAERTKQAGHRKVRHIIPVVSKRKIRKVQRARCETI